MFAWCVGLTSAPGWFLNTHKISTCCVIISCMEHIYCDCCWYSNIIIKTHQYVLMCIVHKLMSLTTHFHCLNLDMVWSDMMLVHINAQWREDWLSVSVVTYSIITNCTTQQPGCDLFHHTTSVSASVSPMTVHNLVFTHIVTTPTPTICQHAPARHPTDEDKLR